MSVVFGSQNEDIVVFNVMIAGGRRRAFEGGAGSERA